MQTLRASSTMHGGCRYQGGPWSLSLSGMLLYWLSLNTATLTHYALQCHLVLRNDNAVV
jgi:hypothetical protein